MSGLVSCFCTDTGLSSGMHLAWGSLVKIQGGGVVLRIMLCARVRIFCVFVPGLTPVFQSSVSPSN